MKATFGAVSMEGCFPLSQSLDHAGPMTTGVLDNAVALSYLLEPSSAQRMRCTPGSETPFDDLHCGLKNLRIGVIDSFQNDPGIDADILTATEAALDVLRGQGAQLSPMTLSPLATYTDCGKTILRSEAFAIHSNWLRERLGEYGARSQRRLLAGASISAGQYAEAQRMRAHLLHEFEEAMTNVDVAVCVSSLNLPCAIDDEKAIERTYDRQARTPFNLIGVPAISVPIGLSATGLPIGLQIVGKRHDEGAVYRAALGLEEALALRLRPPLESLLG
jgi:aspartyl-tRNA(Asn)/glutamyl-tRNA(Gln) amidotransferase subunit A